MAFRAAILPMMKLELVPTLLQAAAIETRPERTALKMPCGSYTRILLWTWNSR